MATKIDLAVERLGEAGQPLLLLHGWKQSKSDLRPLGELIAECARVHLIDLPGFGDSAKPSTDWGSKEYADCLVGYMESQGIQSAILLGHSFGARVAIRCASTYPSRVEALVLISAAGIPRSRSLPEQLRLLRIRLLGILIRYLDKLSKVKRRTWFEQKFGSRDYREAGDLRGILVKTVNEDLTTAAREISCPTLLLWGELDRETPPEMGLRLSKLIQRSTLIEMPGKGHFPYEDVGAHLCAYYILRWLSDLGSTNSR